VFPEALDRRTAVKVQILDDDEFNREGVSLYLRQRGFDVLEAGDAESAREQARRERPDVLVADIVIPASAGTRFQMAQSVGIAVASQLRRELPKLGTVFFSAYEDRGSDIWNLVRDGERGLAYLLKGCHPSTLLNAIGDVLAGRVIIDPEVLVNQRTLAHDLLDRLTGEERPWVERALAELPRLTPREVEVVQRLAAAHTLENIARSLNLAPKTVEHYVTQIYAKTGLDELTRPPASLRKAVILAKVCMIADLQSGDDG
jgi:DNA-binding NarL/FixJ family response regulator